GPAKVKNSLGMNIFELNVKNVITVLFPITLRIPQLIVRIAELAIRIKQPSAIFANPPSS
ncbi:MAG: hypothetical protein ACO25G_04805, partial [Holophagaceae bacterium]